MRYDIKQKEFYHNSSARVNIAEGSVRSGKTWGTIAKWIKYIGNAPPGDLFMVGKTDRSLKRNIINPMLDLIGSDMTYYPGKGEVHLWDRLIYTIGANDERSETKIRGATAAGAYGDEITLWPESFYTMLLSRMSVKHAQFFGSTNPDNPKHWLKKNYLDRKELLNLYTLHFLLDDNTFLPEEYKRDLRNEYIGLWFKRYILGLWVAAEGAIYDFWDEAEYTIVKHPKAMYYLVGIDYGTGNPTAFGMFGVNLKTKPKIWLEKEYYYDSKVHQRQKTDSEYSKDLQKFIDGYKVRRIIIDPSAASFKVQIQRDGMYFITDADNSVIDGIRTQARMLVNREYALGIGCDHAIEDYDSYVWDEKAQEKGEDKPIKANDHTKDMERYVLQTTFGENAIDYSKLTTE